MTTRHPTHSALTLKDFWWILSSPREEDSQRFLAANPDILLDALRLHDRAKVIPKLKLGSEYVTDFVVVTSVTQYAYDACLVEIEPPTAAAFTKAGTFAQRMNQAIGQVSDWLAWCEVNRAYFSSSLRRLAGFDEGWQLGNMSAAILIGRREESGLAGSGRKRALYRHTNRQIDIASYDRVAEAVLRRTEAVDDAPREFLKKVIAFGDEELIGHIAKTTNEDDLIDRLAGSQKASVRLALTTNKSLTERTWSRLLKDKDKRVRSTAALESVFVSEAALAAAARDPNPFTRERAAKNPALALQELLVELASDDAWYVRRAVLSNPNIDETLRSRLLSDEDKRVWKT